MKYTTDNPMKLWSVLVLMLVAVVFLPFGSIWALNHLFHTGIEYTFLNWVASLWLHVVLGHLSPKRSKDD